MRKAMGLFLIILSVCFVACSKDDEDKPSPAANLRGSWKYVGHSGGFAGLAFTPEDSITYFLQFDATRYTAIRNNTQGCGIYNFEKDTANNSTHIGLLSLSGEEYPNKFDTYLNHDTLTLYPHEIMDGFSYHFIYSLKQFDWCDSLATH